MSSRRPARPLRRILRVGLLLALTAGAGASQAQGRPFEPLAARIALQRELGEWMQTALRGVVHPHRLLVTVQLFTRDDVKQIVKRESQPDTVMKVGANRNLRLPGLPTVAKPISGYGAPDISVTVPGKQQVEVRHEILTQIQRISVKLFVDRLLPEPQLAQLKTAAAELASLDLALGDTLEVVELAPAAPSARAEPAPAVEPRLLIVCGTALLCALALALGLARGKAAAQRAQERPAAASAGVSAEPAPDEHRAPSSEPSAAPARGRFQALSGASPAELVEVIASLEPATAAAVLEHQQLDAEAARLLFERLPGPRQLELARLIGNRRELPAEELVEMERVAEAALERARSRVQLGGEARLADLLAAAPEESQAHLLAELQREDPDLASALRASVLLFADLARLADGGVRQVMTAVEPAVAALALKDAAAPLRAKVDRAVSKRLRGILVAEEAALAGKGPAEVERARKQIEQVMRRLRAQGHLELEAP